MVRLLTLALVLQAEETSSSDAWMQAIQALVVIALAILGIWMFRRWIREDPHGEEMPPTTLKRLRQRGEISEEEYTRIRQSLTKRITEELEEKKRQEEERRIAQDPVAAMAAKAKREREKSEASPPPPPPPPPPSA
jgi:hypothetical protein